MPVYKVQRMKFPIRLHNLLVIVGYEYSLLYELFAFPSFFIWLV